MTDEHNQDKPIEEPITVNRSEAQTPEPPKKKPIWKRWWFWAAAFVVFIIWMSSGSPEKPADQQGIVTPLSQQAAQQQQPQKTPEQIKAEKKENMSKPEGDGPIGIGIGKVEKKKSTASRVANKGYTFLHVNVAAVNRGKEAVHVNPNDFTLSLLSGSTVTPSMETYGLSNYFDAINLMTGQISGGWMIFLVPDESEYVLNYQGWGGTAKKSIVF